MIVKQLKINSIKQLKIKYPNRTPIFIKTNDDLTLDKQKFLVPSELTWGEFMCIVRKRLKTVIKKEEALFIFVKDKIPAASALVKNTAKENFDENEMMTCLLTKESTFG
jgi:GABA(A) receptor-associated protein